MPERATEFLIKLSTNPRTLAAFRADPEGAVEAADLSPAERALILSGDPALIQKSLVKDPGLAEAARRAGLGIDEVASDTVVVVVVVVV